MGHQVAKAAAALIGRGVARSVRNARTAAAVGAGVSTMKRVNAWETTPMRIVSNTGPGVAGRAAAIGAGANAASRARKVESLYKESENLAAQEARALKKATRDLGLYRDMPSRKQIVNETDNFMVETGKQQRKIGEQAYKLISNNAMSRRRSSITSTEKARDTREGNIKNKYLAEAAKVRNSKND